MPDQSPTQSACPLCGEPRAQHVPGPPDPPGPGAACLLSGPMMRVPHRRDQTAQRRRENPAMTERYELTPAWHVVDTQAPDQDGMPREMAAATSAADGELIVAALNAYEEPDRDG